ncbi:MAG: hypothetical protein NT027_20360 [Proteobacteria bacterium]|nr:hypothetical protein [Pseudomonadota bacterium]
MSNYFARNTDVWVYGDKASFKEFSHILKTHKKKIKNVAGNAKGMDLLILKPQTGGSKSFIVIHERIVYQSGRFNMELIIGGSQRGFDNLSKLFERVSEFTDSRDHAHLDSDEQMLILPSVFLNIRAPIKNFDEFSEENENDFPLDISELDPNHWTYEELTYSDLFGRIPIR